MQGRIKRFCTNSGQDATSHKMLCRWTKFKSQCEGKISNRWFKQDQHALTVAPHLHYPNYTAFSNWLVGIWMWMFYLRCLQMCRYPTPTVKQSSQVIKINCLVKNGLYYLPLHYCSLLIWICEQWDNSNKIACSPQPHLCTFTKWGHVCLCAFIIAVNVFNEMYIRCLWLI